MDFTNAPNRLLQPNTHDNQRLLQQLQLLLHQPTCAILRTGRVTADHHRSTIIHTRLCVMPTTPNQLINRSTLLHELTYGDHHPCSPPCAGDHAEEAEGQDEAPQHGTDDDVGRHGQHGRRLLGAGLNARRGAPGERREQRE